MGHIEDLAKRYRSHISAPWQQNLAGEQKAIFVVYPKQDERKLRARIELFESETIAAGHKWITVDLTDAFAVWMASTDYRETYFEEPESIAMKLKSSFNEYVAHKLDEAITADVADAQTVIGVSGVACLFGFTRVSLVLKEVVKGIKGRLVIFFPGEYENSNYRLLDARDGWNYLAVPITLHNEVLT